MTGSRTQSSHRSHPSRVSRKSPQFRNDTSQFFRGAPHTHPRNFVLHLFLVVRRESGEKTSVGCTHVRQESMSVLVRVIILGETIPIRIRHRCPWSKYPYVEDEMIVFVAGLGSFICLFFFFFMKSFHS